MDDFQASRLERLVRVLADKPVLSADGTRLTAGPLEARIDRGVVRFREDNGYNASFAMQWNKYRETQLDDVTRTDLTRARFLRETGWNPADLTGQLVLEAGSGAGRFTRIFAESGAELVTFDYSSAVDANVENNGRFGNVTFLQSDIFRMPFRDRVFDRVFCHGVLQHTPDPEGAFMSIERKVKPGGRISIDVYHKDGRIRPWKSKYLWRPLSTRVAPERLLAFIAWYVPLWLPFDTLIKRIPILGNYLGAFIPCWNYFSTNLSRDQKVQWAILDTFDALAPAYDIPVTLYEVRAWFERCGYSDFEVREGGNGIVGNGVRPA